MILIKSYNTSTFKEKWIKKEISVPCRAYEPLENFSVADNTWTNIPFGEISDASNFEISAGYQVKPLIEGLYYVSYVFFTSNQAIGPIRVRFNHSDRIESIGVGFNQEPSSGSSIFYFDGTNDEIALQIKHNNGSPRSIFMTGTEYFVNMCLLKVG